MNSSPDLPISNAYTSRNSTGQTAGSDLSLGLSLSGSSSHQYPQQSSQSQQQQQSSRPGAGPINPPSSYSRQDSYRQDSFRSSDSGYQPSSNFGTAVGGGPQSSSVSSTSKSSRQSDPYSSMAQQPQQPHYSNTNGNGTFASTASTPSRPPLHHSYSTTGATAAGSPSVNRHSYTMGPGGAGSSMSQPPRPVRSGTLPAGEHPGASYSNGMSVAPLPQLSIPPVPAIPSPSTPTSGNSNTFVSTPTPLEQSLESKMNLGPTIPVQTDKELPNGPPTVRARSGTKGSSKDKKSMFGVLSGE